MLCFAFVPYLICYTDVMRRVSCFQKLKRDNMNVTCFEIVSYSESDLKILELFNLMRCYKGQCTLCVFEEELIINNVVMSPRMQDVDNAEYQFFVPLRCI